MQVCIAAMQAYDYAARRVIRSMLFMNTCELARYAPVPPQRRGAWPLVVVALGFIMAMLDVTVVNVALADIRDDLSMSLAGQVWIVDGYTLTFAALLLAGGALANRFGARAVYRAGLAAFVFASVLCGVATSGKALVGARLLQGTAAALFIPSSLGLLARAYPDERERAGVMGLWSAIVSGSAASGPLVGGLLISWLDWRSIFWLNLPIGLVGVWLTPRYLDATPRQAQPLHLGAHGCAVLALGGLAYVLIQGPSAGWDALPVVAAAFTAALASVGFARHQRRDPQPVLPRGLVHDAGFRRINAIGLLINFGVYGTLFLMSLFNQQARHSSALVTGLHLLPLMVMFTFGNLLAVRIVPRHGVAQTLRAGLTLAALGTAAAAACALLDHHVPAWSIDTFVALANLGAAVAIPAMTGRVLAPADARHTNSAAAILNANRQIGALVGVAAVGFAMHGAAAWHVKLPLILALLAAAFAAAAALAMRAPCIPSAISPRPFASTEIIRSDSSPTASGSVLESTLATAVSRGRRSRPPDRRNGRSSPRPCSSRRS